MQCELIADRSSLKITWPDGICAHLPYIWLRDTDPSGFHATTGERSFDLTSVPLDIVADAAAIEGDELVVRWPDARTDSRFSLHWIKAHRPGTARADPASVAAVHWRGELGADGIPRADATSLAASPDAFRQWLVDTKRYGLSLVSGLQSDPEAGVALARRVGHLRETNFGVTFEVISKPNPNNLAYTADALPLHTDLTNQDLPPGYQFLHCLANDAEGGGSTFCDGAAVATALRDVDASAFDLLARTHVPFRFFDANTDIRSRKPIINLTDEGEVSEICFNAHIADVLDIAPEEMPAFYRAYCQYMAMTRDPENIISLKLQAGEMVVFDNRRVLHGREAFDPSTGRRHLRGCYVDRGEWDSRIRVLT